MAIYGLIKATLTGNGTTVDLPNVPLLEGDLSYSPAALAMEISLAGTPVFEASSQSGGRQLVLGDDRSWVTHTTLLALQALAAIPGLQMTLTLHDDRTFLVLFDQRDNSAIEVTRTTRAYKPGPEQIYFVTIRLVTVG